MPSDRRPAREEAPSTAGPIVKDLRYKLDTHINGR